MSSNFDPRIGDWYRTVEGECFEIVARDELDGTLELQYFDGTLDELDSAQWDDLILEPIEPPEDWHGALDIDEPDESEPPEVDRLLDDFDR